METGPQFLHSKQPSLHTGPVVEHEQARRERTGQETSQKPAERIGAFMEVLERIHGHDDPRVLDRIKASYHKDYVIKPGDVPESAFLLEQRIARNLGHGDVPITDEFRTSKIKEIIQNQESSLDKWVDYLTSSDATYPTWAKYWAFTAITKMGKLEKRTETLPDGTERETARFGRRTHDTTAPFPPMNPRALALTIGVMEEKLKLKGAPKQLFEGEKRPQSPRVANASSKLSDKEFQALLSSESFSDIYTQFLIELPEYSTEGLKETRGQWMKYPRGSDPKPLVDSLDGHPLEWCTADLGTAQSQLVGGDFYVYYSIDPDGQPTIPRAAIRMEGDNIAEVRGIASNQELDPYIAEVVGEKMAEFPDGASYQKKAADMARLTELEERMLAGNEPSREDLRFLYEVDGEIEGFAQFGGRDPRIKQLRQGRDVRTDLTLVLGCRPEQISLTSAEATHGSQDNPILFHYGYLDLGGLTSAEGLTLPQSVGGTLSLPGLTSAEGLTLPQSVGGTLELGNLTSAEGLTLPQSVGGTLNLRSLTSAEGLTLPQEIGHDLFLSSLTSAEGLTLPQSVGGGLDLDKLSSVEGLTLPQNVGGYLNLRSIVSAEGLTLPQEIGHDLFLSSLTTVEGLTLPQSLGGSLYLSGLTTVEGLTLPQSLGGSLYLSGLATAEGLTLPQSVGGDLYLDKLTTVEGLTLPQNVGGDLYLASLTTAEGLTLPQSVGGYLYLCRYDGGGAGGYARLSGLTNEQIKGALANRPDLWPKLKGAPPWALDGLA